MYIEINRFVNIRCVYAPFICPSHGISHDLSSIKHTYVAYLYCTQTACIYYHFYYNINLYYALYTHAREIRLSEFVCFLFLYTHIIYALVYKSTPFECKWDNNNNNHNINVNEKEKKKKQQQQKNEKNNPIYTVTGLRPV